MRLDANWLRLDRRGLLRFAVAGALIAPATLIGARNAAPAPEADVPARVAATASDAGEVRQDRERLNVVFARHFDIPLELASSIHEAAHEAAVDPVLAFGLVRVESSFRRTAVSWAGAVGYTQVMPATARWMDPAVGRADLFRSEVNLRLGFEYLSYLMEYYDGDVRLALTAYNRGPGTVDRLLQMGRDPENGYADKVLGTESRRIRLSRS